MVLQGARYDLRARGGAVVDEDDDGDPAPGTPARRRERLLNRPRAALGVDDPLALPEERVADPRRRGQQATRVAAQIEDEAPHLLSLQPVPRLQELASRSLGEVREADVTDARPQQEGEGDRVRGDLGARGGDLERPLETGAHDREPHRRPLRAAQPLRGLRERQRLGRLAVDPGDHVARPHPKAFRRGAVDGGDHDKLSRALADH